jgi:Phytanoyl-CoA dioxygenase (PhyH)
MSRTDVSAEVSPLLGRLEADGIAILPGFLSGDRLAGMQGAFRQALSRLKLNTTPGYEKTELHRDMVEDVLALDQGFVDAALHPLVTETLRAYIGPEFQLVEAKGWLSHPTRRDFHGWHGDEWYDKSRVTDRIPREVKLAIYLTDVDSGQFEYIRGSHQKEAPRLYSNVEVGSRDAGEVIQVRGTAGTACLFDTSGVHRQGVPILQPRHAVFLNYHESRLPLQRADIEGNRYHPLLLNAAFLGGLSDEDRRILGFGDKATLRPGYVRRTQFPKLDRSFQIQLGLALRLQELTVRIRSRLKRLLGS